MTSYNPQDNGKAFNQDASSELIDIDQAETIAALDRIQDMIDETRRELDNE